MCTELFYLQRFANEFYLTEGNDTYINRTSNRIIYALGGNDSISDDSEGENITIDGGTGEDYICIMTTNTGSKVMIAGGADNDTLWNYRANSTISGGSGNDEILNTGEKSTIDGGAGDDSIKNFAADSTVSGGIGNDSIETQYNNTFIDGGADNDYIKHSYGENITIAGGDGNDTIYTDYNGNYVTINGGAGNDSIYNHGGNYKTIDGGANNDYICSTGFKTTVAIYGGDGDDTIWNDGQDSSATISGGAGNDSINIHQDFTYGSIALIQYASGDGNDTITNFNSDDTLHITSGSISSSVISGNDLILTVGSGSIKLQGVKGSTLNLKLADGTTTTLKVEEPTPIWTISGTTATYGTSSNTLLTITGLNYGTNASNLYLNGSTVTLNSAALGTGTVSISGNYYLALGSDIATPSTTAAGWSISGSTATYKSASTTAGYTLSNDRKSVSYTSASGGNTLFTITGLNYGTSASNLSLNGSTVTLNSAALGTGTVSISGNYYLALGSGIATPSTTAAGWSISGSTATYKSAKTTAGYKLSSDGKSVTYTSASGGNTLVTITGLRSGTTASDLYLNGSTVTLNSAALGTDTVSISGNYKLALGSGVTSPSTTAAGWNISGTTATYKTAKTTAGYKLSSDGKSVTYTSASGGNSLVTITGLSSGTTASDLSLSGSTVTLSKNALATNKVTISGDYTLALGSGISKSKTKAAGWNIEDTTAVYNSASTTAGYKLSSDGKSVTYTSASGGDALATITGLKSGTTASDLSLSGSTITLNSAALGTGTVSVSGNYKLALASNVTTPSTTAAGWTISGTTATYKTAKTTAGYKLSSDGKSISYTSASGGNALATVTGLKSGTSASDLSLSGSTVTVKSSALGKTNVSISGDYYLALASNVTAPSTVAAGWSISGDTANYISEKTNAGYTLSEDGKSITYTAESGGKTLATITGLKPGTSANNLFMDGSTVTLNSAALNRTNVSISGDYTLELAGNVTTPSATEAYWDISGTTAKYISAKTSAGYVLSRDKKTVNYKSASGGSTLFTITGLKSGTSENNFSLSGNTVTIDSAALGTGTVSITGNYKLALADDVASPSIVPSVSTGWIVQNTTATYNSAAMTAGYTLTADKKSVNYSPATASSKLVTVTGLKQNTSASNLDLNEETKTVTLKAAALGTGTVSVTGDYILALASDVTKSSTTKADWNISGTTAIYKTESSSKGYALSADKKSVTYNNKNSGGVAQIKLTGLKAGSKASGIGMKNNKTTVTLKSSVIGASGVSASVKSSGYTFALDSKGKLINKGAAAVLKGSKGKDTLIGGKNFDTLIGGNGNDSLSGGKGDDILKGGNGSDIFVYANGDGNDVIEDYQVGKDKIKLTSGKITSSSVSGGDIILKIGTGSITVKNAEGQKINVIDSNGKETSQVYENLPEGLVYNSGKTVLTVSNDFLGEKIEVEDYAKTLKDVTAKGFKNNIEIVGDYKNNSLVGGKGDDTLFGKSGSDILTGGNGKDSFIHYEGNDVITDYMPGEDVIYLSGDTYINGVDLNVNDVIFSTTNGSITVKKAKDRKITIIDAENQKTTKTYGILPNGLKDDKDHITITANSDFDGKEIDLTDYATTARNVDASALKDDVEIFGNDKANSLTGGSGNDQISGGDGNDTLTGGKGADNFVHTEGTDTITDYREEDKIYLDETKITNYKTSGKNVIFTTSTGSITVKNGSVKKITVVDSYGNEKTYSNGSGVSHSLFEENNNFSELDEIVAEKAVAEFENDVAEKVTQENLITFNK